MLHKFITFEGIEGSGKSTQAKMLHEFLLKKEYDAILTREPGGAKASECIREILIDDNLPKLETKTEIFLNFAARLEHVEKLIKPALCEGKSPGASRAGGAPCAAQLHVGRHSDCHGSGLFEWVGGVRRFASVPINSTGSSLDRGPTEFPVVAQFNGRFMRSLKLICLLSLTWLVGQADTQKLCYWVPSVLCTLA